MYLTTNDFHDLYHLLCCLRAFPSDFAHCQDALEGLLAHIESPVSGATESGIVRRTLRPCFPDGHVIWSWVHLDIDDSPTQVVKRSAPYRVLTAILREILCCGDSADQLYRLCDDTHNLPLILADPDWHHMPLDDMLAPYRQRYSPDFLRDELAGI